MSPVYLDVATVVLDLDGVLVMSQESITVAWTKWAEATGHNPAVVLQHVPGRLAVDTVREVAPDIAQSELARHAAWVNQHQISHAKNDLAVRGMRTFVHSLQELGPSAWAVVTSCPKDLALARLGSAGYPIPSTMVTAGDVTLGKPDPEGYSLALRRLAGRNKPSLAIEDSPAGIQAAKDAGTFVVAFTTTHSLGDVNEADAIVRDGNDLELARSPRHQFSVTVRECQRQAK